MADLKKIEAYLIQKKLPHKIIDLGSEVFTVKGVVDAGVNKEEIVKTLIIKRLQFVERSSNILTFIAVVLRGKNRVDFKKVRKIFGSKSELAKADEVKKVVGVPIGAVCPILLDIPVYIDKKVIDLTNVNTGSGDLKKGLEMKLKDLLTAIGEYQIEEFSLA